MVPNDMFVPPRSYEDDMVNAIEQLLEFIQLSEDEIATRLLQEEDEEQEELNDTGTLLSQRD
jgi:hypothetical protein